MMQADAAFAVCVEQAVARIEKRTDAEVVVVVAPRSGSYRDVAMLWASVGTLALLVMVLFVPWSFPPLLVVVDLAVSWAILAWLASAAPFLRLAAGTDRARAQVEAAARAEFVAEAVHGTPGRTGVLVYLSLLEDRVVVLPDLGVGGKVAPGVLEPAVAAIRTTDGDAFVRGLEALGEVLATHVPHTDQSDAVDLPNAPRIRP
jgi:putative membrane protein